MKFDNFTEEMKAYFYSLPKYMQENIIQSDADLNTVEQIKKYSENILVKE